MKLILLFLIANIFNLEAKKVEFLISKNGDVTSITVYHTEEKKVKQTNWNLKIDRGAFPGKYSLHSFEIDENDLKSPTRVISPAEPSMMKYILDLYVKNEKIDNILLFESLFSGKYRENDMKDFKKDKNK